MADKLQNTSTVKTNAFVKGMVKDIADIHIPEGVWTNAINAINNSHIGDEGTIGNEQANKYCAEATYTVIGILFIYKTEWLVFSTDDTNSEIGIFNEADCSYRVLVNDPCLNFKKKYLITGAVKYNPDCTYQAYWQDNNNPDRTMNLSNIPWKENKILSDDSCSTTVVTNDLDCDALRLNPFVKQPCIEIKKSVGGGQLANGSYQAVIAYSNAGIRVTDYSIPSLPIGLWDHTGIGGSIDIHISNLDENFDEYELAVVAVINQQTVVKKVGNYSVSQNLIHLDQLLASLDSIPLSFIPLKSVIYEKSKKMFGVNGYLIRTSVTTQPYFNYQPLANQIKSNWIAVQYEKDYYWKGGNKTGYMRDEVYSFFIRWVYKTGARSASFHIPGREAISSELATLPNTNPDIVDGDKVWQVYDTSSYSPESGTLSDGGVIIAKGSMAYHESTERYPDFKPEVWGALCNKKIRHHKMPSNETIHIHSQDGKYINVLGVQFSNIKHPLDNQGNPIQDIIGYEILRGSREGNRTVIAKGMFNNMLVYDIPGTSLKGYFQNYPYNDLRPDPYLNGVSKQDKMFSFHSPETSFIRPYIGDGAYLKLYTTEVGTMKGNFHKPYKHPKYKQLTDFAFGGSFIVALGIGLISTVGKVSTTTGSVGQTRVKAFGTIPGALVDISAPFANFDTYGLAQADGGPGSGIEGVVNYIATSSASSVTAGVSGSASNLATILSISTSILSGIFYFYQGLQTTIDIIKSMIPYRDYVLQFDSHAFYDNYGPVSNSNIVSGLKPSISRTIDAKYISSGIQDFDATKRINNLYRNKYVAVNTQIDIPVPFVQDNTKNTGSATGINNEIIKTTSAYYGSIKVPFENQYGQLQSINQLPTDSCVLDAPGEAVITVSTPPIFGGDVYINRYTEKNPYFFFNTWLIDLPDGTNFDYTGYINGPEPKYKANFIDYGAYNFGISIGAIPPSLNITGKPSDFRDFDQVGSNGTFFVRNQYMYLFNNGVRDFYAESELNLAYRDYGEDFKDKFYDVYGNSFSDLATMFRSDVIDKPIYYKYDLSLSTAKLYNNFTSWGSLLPRDYDPTTYAECYDYFPYRGIYSLQQQDGLKRDNWRNFLPLNYYTFEGIVTSIKTLNANGAVVLYEDWSPSQFVGVDKLVTDAGTKITIGDGGLFANNVQSLVNAEDALNYGASISSRSVINTPYGLFYVSQKAGKIFNYGSNGLEEISKSGMKYWFLENLPSRLLEKFPDFTEYDNSVQGVAVQAVYDAQYELVYFTKKDYIPLDCVGYDPEVGFYDSCVENPTIKVCNVAAGYVYNPTTQMCEKIISSPACPPGYTYNPGTQECDPPGTEDPYLLCPAGYTYNALSHTCEKIDVTAADASITTKYVADIVLLQGINFSATPHDSTFVNNFIDEFSSEINNSDGDIRIGYQMCSQSDPSNIQRLYFGSGSYSGGTISGTANYAKSWFPAVASNQPNIIEKGLANAAKLLLTGSSLGNGTVYPTRTNVPKIIVLFTQSGPTATGLYTTPCVGSCCGTTGSNNPLGHYPNTVYWHVEMRKAVTMAQCLSAANPQLKIFVVNTDSDDHTGFDGLEGQFYFDVKNAGSVYVINAGNAVAKSNQFINDLKTFITQTITTYSCPVGSVLNGTTCSTVVSIPAAECTCTILPTVDGNASCSCTETSVPNNCIDCDIVDSNCECVHQVQPLIKQIYTPISLGDPKYFTEASWTVSYDPKIKAWISFHDWIPNFMIPANTHFYTIKDKAFWKHNERTDLFANYYSQDKPWEVEFPVVTPNNITTLRSVEYYMEAFKFAANSNVDYHHILDENFDRAYIYNSEQISPILALKIKDKVNPLELLTYPIVQPAVTNILFSKEENKYRFNTFYDITKDRGEFTNTTIPMFITSPDGYHKFPNPAYIDVFKPATQHKKFRHFGNKLVLKKIISNSSKMIVKIINTKLLNSSR